MSEPGWKADLRDDIRRSCAKADGFAFESLEPWDYQSHVDALMPHIEAAYQRGLMAGRSQAGYTTRRKKKEGPCTAGAAGSIPASNTNEEGG